MIQRSFTAQFAAGDRVALSVEYHGGTFFGWQSQRKHNLPTVQETLEKALSRVAAVPVFTVCAGRTDTGVHASHQVIHFDTSVVRPEKAWVYGGNTALPEGVAIKWARPVSSNFHARFSALARRYRYIIHNHSTRSAHLGSLTTFFPYTLDAELMHREAQCLLGEWDFSSFRGAGCQSSTPIRKVHHVMVVRRGDFIVIDIQANAFLLHMVRNIAGTLLAVGSGRQPAGWMAGVLAAKDRKLAAPTAPPQGLYLVDVCYPPEFALPVNPLGPSFLSLMGLDSL